jgi:hypothetical protein
MKFWIPWGIAAVVTSVVVYFFLVGLSEWINLVFQRGSLDAALAGYPGVTAGSSVLKNSGRPGLGALLSLVLALPGLLAGIFMLLILITQSRWN